MTERIKGSLLFLLEKRLSLTSNDRIFIFDHSIVSQNLLPKEVETFGEAEKIKQTHEVKIQVN